MWSLLEDPVKFNHTDFCSTIWMIMQIGLEYEIPGECEDYMNKYDYNSDGAMNFREAVPFMFDAVVNGMEGNTKGPNINCSECVGMDIYNACMFKCVWSMDR